MNDIAMLQEGLTQIFSDNPIIWGKWLLVFAVVILTIVVRVKFKIDDKFDPSQKLDKKVKKAIDNNHIINATLISSYVDREKNTCREKYEYEINGEKHTYSAMFTGIYTRRILHLYYEDNRRKVFTNEEYHYYVFRGLPIIILNFSPFIVGALMVWILGLAN